MGMHDDILAIVKSHWPSDSHRVSDWPEDEQELFRTARDGGRGLDYAYEALEAYRQGGLVFDIREYIEKNTMGYPDA